MIVIGVVIALIAALGPIFGFVRSGLAVVMFFALFIFGSKQVKSMFRAPPEPELADVSEYGLKYVCTMCGLELKVEIAAKDRPPSHCMEPMVLVRTGGRPPLTTVE